MAAGDFMPPLKPGYEKRGNRKSGYLFEMYKQILLKISSDFHIFDSLSDRDRFCYGLVLQHQQ